MASRTNKRLIHVQVIRHYPQALGVETDSGQSGIIRTREISWDEDVVADWRNIYKPGWDGFALPIPSQKGDMQEFSLRLAESDPWDQLDEEKQKDRAYEGIITSVLDYGAFVEIVPGLTGLLHYSQLPGWCKRSPLDLFWPGDKIYVTIQGANRDQRQIDLGIPHLRSLGDEMLSKPASPVVMRDVDNDLEKLLDANSPYKHILVVENEKPQSMAVSGWLRRLHQRVDVVDDAETAIDFLQRTQPDIALVDVGLPGMSGTELANHILEQYPQVQVINVTDWARANDILETLDQLQARGVRMLLKPLLPEDLVPFLLQEQAQPVKTRIESGSTEEKLRLTDVPKLDANESIQLLLERCRERLNFEHVILFSLDPIHRQVKIEDRAGDRYLNKSAVPSLIYSPVRDVAEDHDTVVVNEIGDKDRSRFKYLLELCPSLTSCICVPVQTQTPFDHALFVLDRHSHQITNEQQLYVEGMALAIGTALEQNNMREKFIMMQRTALIGHLTRAMMHEINNLVGPLLYEADTLKRNLKQYEKDLEKPGLENIHTEIHQIEQDIRKVINTTKTFGRIVTKGKSQLIRVDEIILQTVGLLKDISDQAHVEVYFQKPDQLILVESHAVILEQVFLNVLLNSIQQIGELRPDHGGWVKIRIEKVTVQKKEMCRILVEDNGPGIHASLWKKIFAAGFTTRQDGSGIGLYISHNLMEDIHGSIQVSKSHILSGSTFTLEVPSKV